MSIGSWRPSLDLCMISCVIVHRIPLENDAMRHSINPKTPNWVDLYVNIAKPPAIITTIPTSDHDYDK